MDDTSCQAPLTVHLIGIKPRPGLSASRQIAGALGIESGAPSYHTDREACSLALAALGQVAYVLPGEDGLQRCFVTDGESGWAATPPYPRAAMALASALHYTAFRIAFVNQAALT